MAGISVGFSHRWSSYWKVARVRRLRLPKRRIDSSWSVGCMLYVSYPTHQLKMMLWNWALILYQLDEGFSLVGAIYAWPITFASILVDISWWHHLNVSGPIWSNFWEASFWLQGTMHFARATSAKLMMNRLGPGTGHFFNASQPVLQVDQDQEIEVLRRSGVGSGYCLATISQWCGGVCWD